jgi:hypothetical protein
MSQVAGLKYTKLTNVVASVYPDKTFLVRSLLQQSGWNFELPVEIEITNNAKDLKAGMYVLLLLPLTNKTILENCSKKCFCGSVSSNQFLWLKMEPPN